MANRTGDGLGDASAAPPADAVDVGLLRVPDGCVEHAASTTMPTANAERFTVASTLNAKGWFLSGSGGNERGAGPAACDQGDG